MRKEEQMDHLCLVLPKKATAFDWMEIAWIEAAGFDWTESLEV